MNRDHKLYAALELSVLQHPSVWNKLPADVQMAIIASCFKSRFNTFFYFELFITVRTNAAVSCKRLYGAIPICFKFTLHYYEKSSIYLLFDITI